MKELKKYSVVILLLMCTATVSAQIEQPVAWSYAAKKINNSEAVVFIKATIQPGWRVYSTNQKDGGPVKTSFTFNPSADYQLAGKVAEPTPMVKYEDAFDMKVYYFEKQVIFQQKVILKANKTVVAGKLNFMVCNDHKCIPAQDVNFSIPIQ